MRIQDRSKGEGLERGLGLQMDQGVGLDCRARVRGWSKGKGLELGSEVGDR